MSEEEREEIFDLGFGSVVSRESTGRLLNRDGTFNVRRKGLGFFRSLSIYHFLLDITWPRFLGLTAALYIALNALFALGFVALGPGALASADGSPVTGFGSAFFFSVQTLATIGFGYMVPATVGADVLVTLESLLGLLSFGLAAGLIFARFSRPTARIIFSDRAVIAPYRGMTALEFRVVNGRSNQIVDLHARVIFARRCGHGLVRDFEELSLERQRVAFFPLSWTVVHPIDEDSPLHGVSQEELIASDAEFLVQLAGIDETFSQAVHARSSYTASEVIFGSRFTSVFDHQADGGHLSIDVGKLHQIETVD